MKTLLEYITFVKGIEYLIIIAFCFGFIALWSLVHTKEKNVVISAKKVASLVIPLSLVFGGVAIIVNTNGNTELADTRNVSEAILLENYSNVTHADTTYGQDKWFKVNNSEYLAISQGPATKFHKVMSEKISCVTCHHNSGDEIHACKDCHDRPFNPHNSSMPGLKAAYHQRCMSCHKKDFGGPESCTKCHTKEATASIAVSAPPRPHQLTWETCSKCHKDGIPNGGQAMKIVYHDSCLKCHTKGIGGAAKVPDDHAGRTGNTCQGCHRPEGG